MPLDLGTPTQERGIQTLVTEGTTALGSSMRFVDLCAGLGGFHVALSRMGHRCVFAAEIDEELRAVYLKNFPEMEGKVAGDLKEFKDLVPKHDLLCAGFPCQPFSKSGSQSGMGDRRRGTLFTDIADVLGRLRPQYFLLENVGNFEVHDHGRTWRIVQDTVKELGYNVRGTTHMKSGGHGLVSPTHLGFPHNRERFFIVGSRGVLPLEPFPPVVRGVPTTLGSVVQNSRELDALARRETALSPRQRDCIEHWNALLRAVPNDVAIPSPLWGDEFGARYPFIDSTPSRTSTATLRRSLGRHSHRPLSRAELIGMLPTYARTDLPRFPAWKIAHIRQSRDWFRKVSGYLEPSWLAKLHTFPASLRKLEWNCGEAPRNLWRHVLQFRPSGLRVKRYSASPSLVAMTVTQVPILGPERRFLTRVEGLRLLGLPDSLQLPESRQAAFQALGNAVHVDVVQAIAERLLAPDRPPPGRPSPKAPFMRLHGPGRIGSHEGPGESGVRGVPSMIGAAGYAPRRSTGPWPV